MRTERATNWTDQEVHRFSVRLAMFGRAGVQPERAEQVAERCVQRDRERECIHCCAECKHFCHDGTCAAARQGLISGADRFLTPVPDIFHHCRRFAWASPRQGD